MKIAMLRTAVRRSAAFCAARHGRAPLQLHRLNMCSAKDEPSKNEAKHELPKDEPPKDEVPSSGSSTLLIGAGALCVVGGLAYAMSSPPRPQRQIGGKMRIDDDAASLSTIQESRRTQKDLMEANVEAMRQRLDANDERRHARMDTVVEANAAALHRKLQVADEVRTDHFRFKVEGEAEALHAKLGRADEARTRLFEERVEEDAQALRAKLQRADMARAALFQDKLEVEAEALRQKLQRADEERAARFQVLEAKAEVLRRKLDD